MRYKIIISLFLLLATIGMYAQQQAKNPIRIVDTLTAQEKTSRNPVILKTELDSLIKQYNINQVPVLLTEPIKETKDNTSMYMFIVMIVTVTPCCLL